MAEQVARARPAPTLAAPEATRLRRDRLLLAVVFAGLLVLPAVLGAYGVTVLNFIAIRAIAVLGLVLLTGYTGQISFGQAAFVGIGAFASAYLSARQGAEPWLALLAAVALTAAVAALVGIPLLQLEGHYLALGTLAFGIIVTTGMLELRGLTGGPSGFGGIPALALPGLPLDSARRAAYLLVVALGLVTWLSLNLAHGRVSRQMRAVRDSEVTAQALGVRGSTVKLAVFVLAAAYAALSGALYAHYVRFVNPSPFDFMYSVELVTMAVVGGLTSVWGGLLGAAALTLLTEALRDAVPGATGEEQLILFGVLLVAMLIFWREGIAGAVRHLARRLARRGAERAAASAERLDPAPVELRALLAGRPAREPGDDRPALRLERLTRRFGGLVAVDAVSLSAARGRVTAVIGPNGAGKTTLFNLISGLLPPTSGRILLDGLDVAGAPPYRIARLGVARTFQNVEIFPQMTCRENVLVALEADGGPGFLASLLRPPGAQGAEAALSAEAEALLRFVGLGDRLDDLAGSLPLARQRALELARALARRPRLLLLDEPASGLSLAERAEVARLIAQIRDLGITVLLVEHDMEFVMRLADHVAVLNYGEKIAEGPPAAVQRDPAVIAAYLGDVLEGDAPAREASA